MRLGHKCDIRLYVAVTSFDPLLIYLYEEGLVRLATVKYDRSADNLWNPCIHLCNYSINKYHSDYIKATEGDETFGHKWTFSALLRNLKSQGNDTTSLILAIEDVIIKVGEDGSAIVNLLILVIFVNFVFTFQMHFVHYSISLGHRVLFTIHNIGLSNVCAKFQ